MTAARLSLLALSMLAGAHSAFAKTPASVSAAATPLGSPGDWIGSGDYPATALRFDMTGVTVFRLAVDATGKPSRCDIVESSGFDVLDTATCQRLMGNARFSPSRDRSGKPMEGTYSNRVRWVMPLGARPPVSERFASMLLSIDQTGTVTSCRFVFHVPAEAAMSAENPCKQALNSQPPALGLEFRGSFQGPSADVEIQLADVFTPALRARVLSPMPGHEQRALNIHQFTVTNDGKIGQCSYEEQRGSELLATDFCLEARRENFDPPFSAFNKDGVASGWHIMRVLLKTGQ
jgi:TonB family protein